MESAAAKQGKVSGKTVISAVRWTVALGLLVYASLTAMEEYRISTTSADHAPNVVGLKPQGAAAASSFLQAAARRVNWRANSKSDDNNLLQQSVQQGAMKPSRRRSGSRSLAATNVEKLSGFKVHMVHRNSPISPYRREYNNRLEALKEDLAIDEMRQHAFRRQRYMRSEASPSSPSPPSSAARTTSPSSKSSSGSSSPVSSPTLTAVIEGPGASPQHEYNFESPLVSGATLGSGQYFVEFYLGTPPQKFALIVDSGSDLIWVQCTPCKQCFDQQGPLYDPGNSTTFRPVPCLSSECLLIPAVQGFPCDFRYPGACAYEYQYADTSYTRGVFAYETATLGATSATGDVRIDRVAFGCGNENSGASFAAAGGIIGLGQGPLSFTSQIGYAYGNKFSYCLVNYLDPTSVRSSLVFGDIESSLLASTKRELMYTPIVANPRSPTLYYVQIYQVTVNGADLQIPASAWTVDEAGDGGSVFDSGTTITYFVPAAFPAIFYAFDQAIKYPRVDSVQNLDLCFNISGIDEPKYPSFGIKLAGGAYFQPPSDNYFVDVAPDIKCLAMQSLQSTYSPNTIGNLMQQNFLIVYDRDESRIGLTRTNCSLH